MKNLVINLRNAKAQAGCAESKHTSPSFRKGLGVGFLTLLLTLSVGQMWGAKTVYFVNTSNWTNPYCYYWGTSGNPGWPGTAMTNTGKTYGGKAIYKLENIADGHNKCIFNNNSGTQTGDLDLNNGRMYVYNTGWVDYSDDDPVYPDRCIAGNGWGGLSSWNNSGGSMTNNGDGTYTWTSTSVTSGTDCRFKICVCGSWDGAVGYSNKVSGTFCSDGPKAESNDGSNICFKPAATGTVTITYDSGTGNVVITCACATPTISWSTAPANGTAGGSMTATVTTNQTSPTITWTSSNTSAATVNSSGVISYVAAGSTTITAKYTGNGTTYCETEASVTQNITVTAAATRTLTYHANYRTESGNGSGSVPAAQTVNLNASATVANENTLAFVNYTFQGWNTEEHITGTSYSVGSSITMDTNKDLYAVWTRTIPLDDQGATTAVTGDVYGTYNSSSLPSFTNPEKTGYTFQGWYTQIGGGGNFVINTSRVFQASKTNWTNASCQFIRPSTSTSSLYAKWTQTVTLDEQGATTSGTTSKSVTYNSNSGMSTMITRPSKTGYDFGGYYTGIAGSGSMIIGTTGAWQADVSGYTDASKKWIKASGATTIYAKWTQTVTLNANTDYHGSGSNKSATATWNGTALSGFTATEAATGYNLIGYYSSKASGTKVLNADGTYAASNVTDYITSNKWTKAGATTLYAHMQAKTYSVTLDKNGGDSGGSTTATYNSNTLTGFSAASRAGYSCDGYFTASDGGTKVINADGTLADGTVAGWLSSGYWVNDGADITLYAHWTVNATYYTLHYTYGTGLSSRFSSISAEQTIGGAAIADNESLVSGTGVTLTATPAAHYRFVGWYSAAGCAANTLVSTDNPYSFSMSANTNLYAKAELMTTVITLNANGGAGGTSSVTATHGSRDLSSAITKPTRTGYTLSGWYTPESSGTRVIMSTGYTASSASGYTDASGYWTYTGSALTLYAHWTANTYKVTFDKQSGSGGSANVTATYNAAMPSATMPTRAGYDFNGYYGSTGGSGTKYYNADGSSAHVWDVASATTIYAHWTAHNYTITYSPASAPTGCTYTTKPTSAGYNSTVDMVITPSTGYTVSVSAVDASSNTVTVTPGANNHYTFTQPASAVTVTVTATEVKSTITVTANNTSAGTLKFGSTDKSWGETASVGVTTSQNITATANSGYVFDRWVLSGGAASSSTLTNTTITLKANGSGDAGTAKAVFGKTYYYRGDKNSWGADLMTRHEGGYYAYYQTSGTHTFQCTPVDNSWDVVYYTCDNSYGNIILSEVDNGYGGTKVSCPESGSHYICILYPNTTVNDGANPVIFASTTLPDLAPETTYATTFYAGDHGAINAKGTAIAKNGNASVNIGSTARALTATPESGYSFDYWETSGSVTVADIYSASTTVTASAAGGTVTAHYLANSGWYLQGGFDNYDTWETSAKALPVDRPYRGISGVYYRPFSTLDNDDYFGMHDGTNKYSGHTATDKDYDYNSLDQVATLYVNSSKSFQAKTAFSNKWAVIKTTDTKKFWIQSPATYYTLTVSSDHGTVTTTENSYGNLETTQFASGERINISITAADGYVINNITIGATTVAANVNALTYSGNTTMPAGDATLTVTYVAEPTHDVTVSVSPAGSGTTTPAAGTVAVKEYRGTSIEATPDNFHYFTDWTISGGGITPTTSNTNPQTFKATTTGGSITANFANKWYLKGSFNGWEGDLPFNTIDANTAYVDVNLSSNAEFKLFDSLNDVWYGSQYGIERGVRLTTELWSDNSNNCPIAVNNLDGTYRFTLDLSGTNPKITVTYPVINQLRMYTADPAHAEVAPINHEWDSQAGTVYSKTLTLNAKTTYKFKVVYNSDFYGFKTGDPASGDNNYENPMTIADCTDWQMYTDGGDSYLYAPVAGDYTFNFNSNNSGNTTLSVVFPQSAAVIYGVGTLEGGSAVTVSPNFDSGDYVLKSQAITFTRGETTAGYQWKGWYDNPEGTGVALGTDATFTSAANTRAHNVDYKVYACYDLATYTVTLSQTGAGTPGSQTSVTATYTQAMPAISGAGTLPVAPDGYGFMGYWDAADGEGTQYYNADGTSAHVWDKTAAATLYPYFKKGEITALTFNADMFDPITEATGNLNEDYIIANPTMVPIPEGTRIVCWQLLYDNNNPVPSGHEAQAWTEDNTKPDQVRFSIVGLAAGTYKVRATLRTGNNCGAGTELSTYEKTFSIASAFMVTVMYKVEGESTILAPSITVPGKATVCTEISAPDFFGYTFNGWQMGDGITSDDETDQQEDFCFKASFSGTLTAEYTRKEYIYLDLSEQFSVSGKWSDPYVYFYNGDPWDETYGAGATGHSHYISGHAMTQIEGSDIWYFDYANVSGESSYVAFTWGNHTSQQHFYEYDAMFRTDFSEGTPLFVPATDQTALVKNTAKYYNEGYWVKYLGDLPGYTMLVYNSEGNEVLKREHFVSNDGNNRMNMTVSIDLDAASTYQIEVYRDNGYYYKAADNFTSSSTGPKAVTTDGVKHSIQTNAAGFYKFTLGYSSGDLRLSVEYPAAIGDFRLAYTDNATWALAHTVDTWVLPSKTIRHRENGVDTVSFFVSKGKGITSKIRWEKVSAVGASNVTWGTTGEWTTTGLTDVDEAGVYNFRVTQNADGTAISSIERIGAYSGTYYIRCGALNSKWDHYTTDPDHRMTYTSFSESEENKFGKKYSHYKAKWCPAGKDVRFCIANDYSPCLTDTLVQDVGNPYNNIDAGTGRLLSDGNPDATANRYSANIRFMWNRFTNEISRAYVGSSTNASRLFLVLRAAADITDENGTSINDHGVSHGAILKDDENWIYERIIKVTPNTRFKLFACYAEETPSQANAQYFRGIYDDNKFTSDENSVILIGGSGSTKQKARIIYDFRTNRLVAAWMPDGDVDSEMGINADVMVIREHQGPADYITFTGEGSKLTGVRTVYGAMKFNRWILNNRANPEDISKDHCRPEHIGNDLSDHHPVLPIAEQKSIYERSLYFISFPFDVRVSEIFGFGRYWDEWYLEYYDGLNRAKNGYWMDSPPNWKFVEPAMADTMVLRANVGYILGLDLDYMGAEDISFWSNGISTVELYFPSTVNQEVLEKETITLPALSDEYQCTINRGTAEGDRRVKDSYWRCMGVPSFNIYNSELKDANNEIIGWQTNYDWDVNPNTLPFIYMWNKTDNTLTAQATRNFEFLPMHAYLVQARTAITWTNVSGSTQSSIVARRQREEDIHEYNWRLTLNEGDEFVDQTYIRMTDNEEVTDDFDFNQDLIKELYITKNGNVTKNGIYSLVGYERVAANSMVLNTSSTTLVPLGLLLNAGTYTIALPDGANGVGIFLNDIETGERTNLSAGMTYTFTATKGYCDNRFFLEISPIHSVPTGVDEVQGNNGQDTKARKMIIDQNLFIIRDGNIFDARGARLR